MFRRLFNLNQRQLKYAIKWVNLKPISDTTYLRNNCAEESGEIDLCNPSNNSVSSNNNESIPLIWHFAPVDIDYDQVNEFDEKPEDIENVLRMERQIDYDGEYKFNGIKVFVPKSKMLPGTLRNKIIIPEDMPDDQRIISFDNKRI